MCTNSYAAFGHSSRASVGPKAAASIAFAVLAALLSIALTVLWLLKEDIAQKLCLAAAHATFVTLAVALATAAESGSLFSVIALWTALIFSLLLCVHHWNALDLTKKSGSNGNGNGNTSLSGNGQVSSNVVTPPV